MGHARGRSARQAHRQASGQAELVAAKVHRRSGGARPTARERSELRLSLEEREEISRGLAAGPSIRAIAAELGRSPSTVCRRSTPTAAAELSGPAGRSGGGEAGSTTEVGQARPVPAVARGGRAQARGHWSPQQISSWLAEAYPDNPEMQVSHETIYQSLFVQGRGALRKELHLCLRTGRAMRRAKAYIKGQPVGPGQIRTW